MFGQSLAKYVLDLGAAMLLVACVPIDDVVLGQPTDVRPDSSVRVVVWSEQQLKFVADSRMGRVQSYRMDLAQPAFVAQTDIAARRWVLDLQVDAKGGQLWVLGDDGVAVHDARTLVLQKHIALMPGTVTSLRMEDGQVSLVGAGGTLIGAVDCLTLLASWKAPLRRG